MGIRRRLIGLVFIFSSFALNADETKYNFSDEQYRLLKIAFNVGKNIHAKNGMSFEKALSSIVLTETTSGKYIIGDSFDKDRSRRHLLKNSLGPFQIRLSTVRVISRKIPSLKYLQDKSDWYIMNKLLNDYVFGAVIAGNYLKYNYERTGNDYFKCISRYNGGNKNITYYNKVMNNMIIISDLSEKGAFG